MGRQRAMTSNDSYTKERRTIKILTIVSVIFGILSLIGAVLQILGPATITFQFTGAREQLQQVLHPASNTQSLREIFIAQNINNNYLSDLYIQAHNDAIKKYSDAKLHNIRIYIYPYVQYGYPYNVTLVLYSGKPSDRSLSYCSSGSDSRKMEPDYYFPDTPTKSDDGRTTFSELPWDTKPYWDEMILKAIEKIGPLSLSEKTYFEIFSTAKDGIWHTYFYDGDTGKDTCFYWDEQYYQFITEDELPRDW
jgi:hypothetical protein